ncbi:hypothetical protein [Streptomyces sp. NPDC059402]|uniref:hypothetical protein n=1 Tax=Streptomyces sp. NPDC059402 TaxID=3346822 RepID=UPI00369AB95E
MPITAQCQHTGMARDTLQSYLQVRQTPTLRRGGHHPLDLVRVSAVLKRTQFSDDDTKQQHGDDHQSGQQHGTPPGWIDNRAADQNSRHTAHPAGCVHATVQSSRHKLQ